MEGNRALSVEFPTALAPFRVPILSYLASLNSTMLGFPLDSLKTRMQVHKYTSTWQCVRVTVQTEGVRGLFRGIMTPALTSSFTKSIGLSSYTMMKGRLETPQDGTGTRFGKSFVAGCASGTAVALVACPFEITKVFQQVIVVVNRESHGKALLPTNVRGVVSNIVAHKGLLGMYSGLQYHLARDVVTYGVFFSLYDLMKSQLSPNLGLLTVPVSSFVSAIVCWVSVFPIDSLKSQYQRNVLRNIIRVKNGQKTVVPKLARLNYFNWSLYRGIAPSIFKAGGGTILFFSGFETLMAIVK